MQSSFTRGRPRGDEFLRVRGPGRQSWRVVEVGMHANQHDEAR